ELVAYFKQMALRAWGALNAGEDVQKAKTLRDVLKARLAKEPEKWMTFSRRALHQVVKSQKGFRKAEDLDGALRELVEHRYIRPVKPPAGRGGRPSERYEVINHPWPAS